MPVYDPIKLGIRPCQCGRLSDKIHCPHCGSYDTRALAKENVRTDINSGEQEKHRVHRCRKCFKTFDDYEWQYECHAKYWESKQAGVLRRLEEEYKADQEKAKVSEKRFRGNNDAQEIETLANKIEHVKELSANSSIAPSFDSVTNSDSANMLQAGQLLSDAEIAKIMDSTTEKVAALPPAGRLIFERAALKKKGGLK